MKQAMTGLIRLLTATVADCINNLCDFAVTRFHGYAGRGYGDSELMLRLCADEG
jgi:hypothetical protein